MVTPPDKGDLVYLNFNPQTGYEQAGKRPGIVLSPKLFNQSTGFAVVCPITNQSKGYPFEVDIPSGFAITGVILTDQIKSLDWKARQLTIKDKATKEVVSKCISKIQTFLILTV